MGKLNLLYVNENRNLSYDGQENLLQALLEQAVPIDHVCGGMASCGTCRIIVVEGLDGLHERNELEQEMATDRAFLPEERLACQSCPTSFLRFKLPTK